MSDFPSKNDYDAGEIALGILGIIIIVILLLGAYLILHGAFTQNVWEIVWGAIIFLGWFLIRGRR